jgi:hypothetical protein
MKAKMRIQVGLTEYLKAKQKNDDRFMLKKGRD